MSALAPLPWRKPSLARRLDDPVETIPRRWAKAPVPWNGRCVGGIVGDMPDSASLKAEALTRLSEDLTLRQREMLSLLCHAPCNELSAGEIARSLGLPHHGPINLEAANLAKRLTRLSGVEPPRRNDGSVRWWAVLFTGQYSGDRGCFLWRLRPELRDAAIECKLVDSGSGGLYPEVVTGALTEGSATTIRVSSYERNPLARKRCLEHYGPVCVVCNLDFTERYGPVADGAIHVHHIRPIASIGVKCEVDPIRDLRPVCANCHVVIHRRDPPFSVQQVQAFLREASGRLSRAFAK